MLVQSEEKMLQVSLTELEEMTDGAEEGNGNKRTRDSSISESISEDVALNGQFKHTISKPRKRKLGMGDLFQGIYPRPVIRERFNGQSRVVQVLETEPEVTKVVAKSRRNGMWNIFLGLDIMFLELLGMKNEKSIELIQDKDSLYDVSERTDIVTSYEDIL